MIKTLRYQIQHLGRPSILLGMITLVIASLIFTSLGISDYRRGLEEQAQFLSTQAAVSDFIISPEQRGVAGFELVLQPPPLSVIFNRSAITQGLRAGINTSEVIRLNRPHKGRAAFVPEGRFGDLNQLIAIFGALLMLLLGFDALPTRRHLLYFGRGGLLRLLWARGVLLNGFFLLLLSAPPGYAWLRGIRFDGSAWPHYLAYLLTSLLVLNLFYLLGGLMKVLFRYRRGAAALIPVLWFILVMVLPEAGKLVRASHLDALPASEQLNREKQTVLLEAEQVIRRFFRDTMSRSPDMTPKELKQLAIQQFDGYMNGGYLENQQKETAFLEQLERLVRGYGWWVSLSPVDYLTMLSREVSGMGWGSYFGFSRHTMAVRDRFFSRYRAQRYRGAAEEPLVTDDEAVYRSESGYPPGLPVGAVVLVLYLSLLWVFLLRRTTVKKKEPPPPPKLPQKVEAGTMIFLLVNKDKRDGLYHSLLTAGYSGLDTESHETVTGPVTVSDFLVYASGVKGLDISRVRRYLGGLGFENPGRAQRELNVYERKAVMAALVLAEGKGTVCNDFLAGAPADFERRFLDLAAAESKTGRMILYLSADMYLPAASFAKKELNVENYRSFRLNPKQISLR